MRLSALFEEFCKYLSAEKGAAPKSIATYRFCFADFIEFVRLEVKAPVAISHFTVETCRSYQYALDTRGLVPNTVRLRLAVLSSFGRWGVRHGRLRVNPIDRLTRPRKKTKLPRVPRFTAVESWLSNGLDPRAKAVVALMSYGGLRRSELAALDIGDYDAGFGLRRVQGKGGDEAGVALPVVAREIVDTYLHDRDVSNPNAPLFTVRYRTLGGKTREVRMTDRRVYKLVKQIGVHVGAPQLHPHALRHACAAELLRRTNNLRAVQTHLRHADIQTTTIYTRLAQPEMVSIVGVFDGISVP